ncbi:MAG: hypothetical protein LBS38_00365 [Endomicrobium sp.]|jgi:hypothetical protein|nr:hypothetical protein [Endomicrobium sp.]
MNKKSVYFIGFFLLFLNLTCFGLESKYIVFFAETVDISKAVLDKIYLSSRFCIVVPHDCTSLISENLEEFVSVGKIELAASFTPEPDLTVLAKFSNADSKKKYKYNRNNIFENYILDNLSSFVANTNKENFGIFLNSAKMAHDIIYYFADRGLSWVNADNIEGNTYGAYYVDGIIVFSLYKNFPYSQQEVVKWLESKRENIVPVLLTKKHLQNVKLMEYIIGLFDSSRDIKPATPLYIVKTKNDILQKKDISFEKISLTTNISEKLHSAAQAINNYSDSSSCSETVYSNVQNEFVYLCGRDVLEEVSSNSTSGKIVFDAAYNNIFRLLGLQTINIKDSDKKIAAESVGSQKTTAAVSNRQTSVEIISEGVSIRNEGLLRLVKILPKEEGIKISLFFNGNYWNDEVSFVDFYIDLNGISGMGGSSFIPGVSGFLIADSGWEYALRIYKDKAVLYKYSVDGASIIYNIVLNGTSVVIPSKYIRGNPAKWGFQAIVVSESEGKKSILDFLNQSPKTKSEILSAKPFQAPLVRH